MSQAQSDPLSTLPEGETHAPVFHAAECPADRIEHYDVTPAFAKPGEVKRVSRCCDCGAHAVREGENRV